MAAGNFGKQHFLDFFLDPQKQCKFGGYRRMGFHTNPSLGILGRVGSKFGTVGVLNSSPLTFHNQS